MLTNNPKKLTIDPDGTIILHSKHLYKDSATAFVYRQLQNDLIYISKSIIDALQFKRCTVSFNFGGFEYNSGWYELHADMEKVLIVLTVFFDCPRNGYSISLWDKNTPSCEEDQNFWSKISGNKNFCPGKLAFCHHEEDSDECISGFNSKTQDLVYKYFLEIQDIYLSIGSVTHIIKSLL